MDLIGVDDPGGPLTQRVANFRSLQHQADRYGGNQPPRRHARGPVHRLCILSAVCGGLLAFFLDVVLVGPYGTAGNCAAPIISLILLLAGFVSPPAVLLWTRWQAQRDHALLQIGAPVLAARPETTSEEKAPSKEKDQGEPQAAPESKEHEQREQSPPQGQQGTPSTTGPEAIPPADRQPAILGPIIVDVAQPRRSGPGMLVAVAVVLAAFAGGVAF